MRYIIIDVILYFCSYFFFKELVLMIYIGYFIGKILVVNVINLQDNFFEGSKVVFCFFFFMVKNLVILGYIINFLLVKIGRVSFIKMKNNSRFSNSNSLSNFWFMFRRKIVFVVYKVKFKGYIYLFFIKFDYIKFNF